MDYRYETNDLVRDFHKKRRAFIILNNKIEFLPYQSDMSHYEYFKKLHRGEKIIFNNLIRGYYIDENLVFYKDNFLYDNALIEESLKYIKDISKFLNIKKFNIYFGQKPEENFKLDLFYGKFVNGRIIKN